MKIVLWLDNGPYAYQFFAIALSLSKLGNYEFYGIVARKQDYEFLQNQNILSFKKLFYYPDSYLKKTGKPNYDYLVDIEKKFGLNLWLNCFSERSFYEYRTHFYKFNSIEILNIVESITKFFINVLDNIKPDFIIMQTAGENLGNILLYELAKKHNVKTYMLVPVRLHNTFVLSDNLIGNEIQKEFKKLKKINFQPQEYDVNYLSSKDPKQIVKIVSSFLSDDSNYFEKLKRFPKRLVTDPEPIYQNKGKVLSKMLSWKMKIRYETNKRQKFLFSKSLKTVKDENIIFFPLHVSPERTTLVNAPFFNNQLSLIENIAKSIPANFILYVKEHPTQRLKYWRPIEFYQTLSDLPNVKLIHPDVDSGKIISKSKLIMAIYGTTGFEALFYKKPVIVFSDVFYDCVSSVKKIKDLTQLPDAIRDLLQLNSFDSQDLSYLLEAIKNISINAPFYQIMSDALKISSYKRKHTNKQTEIRFMKFFNKYESDFSVITNAYHKKFNTSSDL